MGDERVCTALVPRELIGVSAATSWENTLPSCGLSGGAGCIRSGLFRGVDKN